MSNVEESILNERAAALAAILKDCGSVCIGYSGGVDSAFLACFAVDVLGRENVLAVTGRSVAYPRVQRDMALECARRFGIPHLEIETDELSNPDYAANPSNRCYFCKAVLWSRLEWVAAERGLLVVLDGSNADDATDQRPGMRAAAEHGVRSPLLEAGLGKSEIRALSRRLGLPTWDQPSSPCLSSRLPYGLAVTPERLRQVEAAEDALRLRGFREFRVRHHGDAARLELAPDQIERALARSDEVHAAIRAAGFERVLLDVEGYRRGALNEGAALVQLGTGQAEPVRGPRVTPAGHQGEIAVAAPGLQVRGLAARAREIKARGFRYVALELCGGRTAGG